MTPMPKFAQDHPGSLSPSAIGLAQSKLLAKLSTRESRAPEGPSHDGGAKRQSLVSAESRQLRFAQQGARFTLCNRQPGGVNDARWKLFLWRGATGSLWRAGGDGLLPLPFMSLVVSGSGECVHAVEARVRARHLRRRRRSNLSEDCV